jgi:hypothetical protein
MGLDGGCVTCDYRLVVYLAYRIRTTRKHVVRNEDYDMVTVNPNQINLVPLGIELFNDVVFS